MIWLAGNSFYGSKQIFSPEFLRWLEGFPAARVHLEKRDGQYELTFPGKWTRDHDVGNPGARHHQRTAQPLGAEDLRSLRARRGLCARQGQDVGEGGAAEAAPRTCASPISARAGGIPSCGSAGASRR
jgi:hypothetical protein